VSSIRRAGFPEAGALPPASLTFSHVIQLEHLLKVADSVMCDAGQTWSELWAELQRCTTPNGLVGPEAKQGFVPECGWPEFLEKFLLLKHYLDAARRICHKEH
jgi:hypothetical protein